MKNNIFKGKKFKIAYALGLTAFTAYALLDTFVIPRSYSGVMTQAEASVNAADGTVTVDRSVFETAKGTNDNAESIAAETLGTSSAESVADTVTEDAGTSDKADHKKSRGMIKDSSETDETGTDDSSGASTDGNTSEKSSGKPGEGTSGRGERRKPGENSSEAQEPASQKQRPSGKRKSSSGEQQSADTETTSEPETTTIETVSSDTVLGSYEDSVKTITLSEYRASDTAIYVADIQLTGDATEGDETAFSANDLIRTALAEDTYGKNIKAETSDTAVANDAILAINGDFYGAQNAGYVIRNGVLYRSTSAGNEDLAILADGTFEIFSENDLSAEEVLSAGAVDVLSFGPGLVEDSEIAVTKDEEVGKAMASNPRTAIGILEDGHYVFVVTDGRTDESEGLTLYQLAEFMQSLGCTTAYNLDGGGSSTMYFNGQIVNNPTTGGNSIKERSVSDIVYIGKS